MLWVYGDYKYVYSYSAGIDFSRQILSRTVRVKQLILHPPVPLSFYLRTVLKVIYHPLYGLINFVLIWGDWL